jgi:hypothetical protein
LATNINDVELQRARTAAKAIEKDAITEDPKINPEETFAKADELARTNFSGRSRSSESLRWLCRSALNALLSSSPVSQRP